MNSNPHSHVGSSNEYVAAAKLSPAHIASPFAAMRRHSLKKKNQKIVDGKTIKDPAFKALFLDILGLETFLQNPQTLFKAAENARSCGKPDAARKLGNLVTAIASGWN